MSEPLLQFTFELDDPHLEIAEKLNFATKLLPILRDRAPVERVDRAENLNPHPNAKPGIETLVGVLSAEVTLSNLKKFLQFLGDRPQDKPIKGSIKVGENAIEFEVKSRLELEALEKTALNLIAALNQKNDD